MAIDNPLEAAQQQLANEQIARSPLIPYASEIISATTGVKVDKLVDWVNGDRVEKLKYLVDVVIAEVKDSHAKISALKEQSHAHRQLLDQYPGLVLDALKRAEEIRGRDRIGRIGAILVNTLREENPPSADEIEDLVRIATLVNDGDARVLAAIKAGQQSATDAHPIVDGMSIDDVRSACAKLDGLGLVISRDRDRWSLTDETWQRSGFYRMLKKGEDFVRFVETSIARR